MPKKQTKKKVGQVRAKKQLEPVCIAMVVALKCLRKKHSWSFEELARRSGVSAQMLSYLERKERRATLPVIDGISRAFHLKLEKFMAIIADIRIKLDERAASKT